MAKDSPASAGRGRARGLLLTGGGGAGKTKLAQTIGGLLTRRGLPTAVIDIDWLAQFGPSSDRRVYDGLRRRNLAAVWANYRACGAQHVIVSAWLESREECAAYVDSLAGCDAQVVRIVTPLDLVERRTTGTDRGPQWNLDFALESHERAAELEVEDFTVSNDRSPTATAEEILDRAGWL
jgi:chloramphenicol 3-O-phosphotransferase